MLAGWARSAQPRELREILPTSALRCGCRSRRLRWGRRGLLGWGRRWAQRRILALRRQSDAGNGQAFRATAARLKVCSERPIAYSQVQRIVQGGLEGACRSHPKGAQGNHHVERHRSCTQFSRRLGPLAWLYIWLELFLLSAGKASFEAAAARGKRHCKVFDRSRRVRAGKLSRQRTDEHGVRNAVSTGGAHTQAHRHGDRVEG